MKKGQKILLGVISHWGVTPDNFTAVIRNLFDGLLSGHPIAALRCLGDRSPALKSWAERREEKSPFVIKPISTNWKAGFKNPVKTRNEAFFTGLTAVLLVGEVKHRSAFEMVKIALRNGLNIYQSDEAGEDVHLITEPQAIKAEEGFVFGSLENLRRAGNGAIAESEPELWARLAGEKKERKAARK
jgi:hypothetical protein